MCRHVLAFGREKGPFSSRVRCPAGGDFRRRRLVLVPTIDPRPVGHGAKPEGPVDPGGDGPGLGARPFDRGRARAGRATTTRCPGTGSSCSSPAAGRSGQTRAGHSRGSLARASRAARARPFRPAAQGRGLAAGAECARARRRVLVSRSGRPYRNRGAGPGARDAGRPNAARGRVDQSRQTREALRDAGPRRADADRMRQLLETYGFRVGSARYEAYEGVAPNTVLKQFPPAGTRSPRGRWFHSRWQRRRRGSRARDIADEPCQSADRALPARGGLRAPCRRALASRNGREPISCTWT